MKRKLFVYAALPLLIVSMLSACQPGPRSVDLNKKTIVVTYSIIGSIVKELAGDPANVVILMPNGADPHEWEPSAKDIEALNRADLIIQNGLDLENGLLKTLKEASLKGVKTFTACDHITIRKVGRGEGIPNSDADQASGAADPHFWTDPIAMKSVVAALSDQIKADLAIDIDARSVDLQARLDSLNREISDIIERCPRRTASLSPVTNLWDTLLSATVLS
jgi:zinc/manganese transport system substrate-binding protein